MPKIMSAPAPLTPENFLQRLKEAQESGKTIDLEAATEALLVLEESHIEQCQDPAALMAFYDFVHAHEDGIEEHLKEKMGEIYNLSNKAKEIAQKSPQELLRDLFIKNLIKVLQDPTTEAINLLTEGLDNYSELEFKKLDKQIKTELRKYQIEDLKDFSKNLVNKKIENSSIEALVNAVIEEKKATIHRTGNNTTKPEDTKVVPSNVQEQRDKNKEVEWKSVDQAKSATELLPSKSILKTPEARDEAKAAREAAMAARREAKNAGTFVPAKPKVTFNEVVTAFREAPTDPYKSSEGDPEAPTLTQTKQETLVDKSKKAPSESPKPPLSVKAMVEHWEQKISGGR